MVSINLDNLIRNALTPIIKITSEKLAILKNIEIIFYVKLPAKMKETAQECVNEIQQQIDITNRGHGTGRMKTSIKYYEFIDPNEIKMTIGDDLIMPYYTEMQEHGRDPYMVQRVVRDKLKTWQHPGYPARRFFQAGENYILDRGKMSIKDFLINEFRNLGIKVK